MTPSISLTSQELCVAKIQDSVPGNMNGLVNAGRAGDNRAENSVTLSEYCGEELMTQPGSRGRQSCSARARAWTCPGGTGATRC